MDLNQFEIMKVFVKLTYAVAGRNVDSLSKEEAKKYKKLSIQAKRILRNQNMEMSLYKLEAPTPNDPSS